MAKIVIIGPGHPLRGGLATFNQRLAKEFISEGNDCYICSFSLQYPSFLFPGTTQYTEEPAPEGIKILPLVNSVNPLNWIKVGNRLKKEKPDLIIVRYWLPVMGPALGTILRRVKKNKHTQIVCIADNILPHEKRPGDKQFTNYFVKSCDAFITMSEKVLDDLRTIEKNKPALLVNHPLYDNFGEPVKKSEARKYLGLPANEKLILFFGFIRKYKGLDILLDAMNDVRLKTASVKLVIAGEFYEDEKPYLQQIAEMGLQDQVILRTKFIPDSEVRYYLCAADAVIQPYRNATQSGVTPLAYHFEKPMIVTSVGGLPMLVPDGKAGLVVSPDAHSVANGILRFYDMEVGHFAPFIKAQKNSLSWSVFVQTIFKLYNQPHET